MNREDALTLKAIVLYVLKNIRDDSHRSVYYVVKTAFYAQQEHLAKYACPLFKDKIVALQFGPVPSDLYDALKIARGDAVSKSFHENDELHLVSDSIVFKDEYYTAKEDPDMDYLSSSAIICIDKALDKIGKMSFNDIVDNTHGEEWNKVYHKQGDKTMSLIAIAEEGGADNESLSYLNEDIEIDKMFK